MIRQDVYLDTAGRDETGGDAAIALRRSGQLDTQTAEIGWVRDSDALPELPEQAERDRWRAALSAEGERRRWGWSASLAWDRLDYLDDNPDFGRDERDRDRLRASAGWDLLGGGDSRLGGEVRAVDERRSDDSPSNPHRALMAHLRWRTALATRTTAELRLGGGVWRYTGDSFQDPANDDQSQVSPYASFEYRWLEGAGASFWLKLTQQDSDAVVPGANGASQTLIEATLRRDLADRLDAVASAWWSRRRDHGAVPGGERRTATDTYARIGLEYRLRDGLGLRAWGSWLHTRNGDADDERAMAAIELVAAL